jgi:lambda repressor-like predicted transcriptional regulator
MALNTMIAALAHNCRAARTSKGVSLAGIADDAGVSESVIKTFEEGKTWPKKVEQIVDAYAQVVGTEAWKIWDGAAGNWGDPTC